MNNKIARREVVNQFIIAIELLLEWIQLNTALRAACSPAQVFIQKVPSKTSSSG
jgi:hypothetical protein